jgi:predicted TIM-barrel fold metal-dependent hydrolase
VHPEPYQDDHRYLDYCLTHESPKGLFKGTCLFDPLDPKTPGRMKELSKRHPGRIVALRIHEMNGPGKPSEKGGAIKNRDMRDPAMKTAWRAAGDLGMAIQMHFLPHHSAEISALAGEFRDVAVILDHMGRAGQGSEADTVELLKLSRHPRVYFKFSGVGYSSKQKAPFADAKPLVRRALEAFGAERILWGGLGHSMKEFEAASQVFNFMFDFAPEEARGKIRGLNAAKLFHFSTKIG